MKNLFFNKKNIPLMYLYELRSTEHKTTVQLFFLSLSIFCGFLFFDVAYSSDNNHHRSQREKMVIQQIQQRGISDTNVLEAMHKVPRHLFVPEALRGKAYGDHPLAIGEGQTISQPYIVALMTESLKLSKNNRVLEIGTGSGYQAAVLAEVVDKVYSIEIRKNLYHKAVETLQQTGYPQVRTLLGDGYFGWEDSAPFDAIMITASVDHIPPPLLSQLKDGGKLILPLGNPFSYQNLTLVTREGDDYSVKQITGVLFVPMTGHALR